MTSDRRRARHDRAIVFLVVLALLAVAPASRAARAKRPDIDALIEERSSRNILAAMKRNRAEKVEERLPGLVLSHAQFARDLNEMLYPNPSLQAWINSIGHALMPPTLPPERIVVFKVYRDPVPQAFCLATGSVFVSTGMVAMAENESQLAYILAHEGSHVLLNHPLQSVVDEVNREARSKNAAAIAAAFVGLAAASAAKNNDATTAEAMGAAAGAGLIAYGVTRGISESFPATRFNKKAQKESDSVAVELLLRAGYDPREGVKVLRRMRDVLGRSRAAVSWMSFAANRKYLEARIEDLEELLGTVYVGPVDEQLSAGGFRVASPRFNQLIGEVKRDNGILAYHSDLFQLAWSNLDEAHALIGEDALTLYYLGLVTRAIARTVEERDAALGYFRAALAADRFRHRLPRAWLEYAVELLDRGDPAQNEEVARALRAYVEYYQAQHRGLLPPDIDFVYDALDRAGEVRWAAYPVIHVSMPSIAPGIEEDASGTGSSALPARGEGGGAR